MKILIADDDTLQRELLKGFLENQGHLILAASDGHEALKLFETAPVQLVLLDQRMPGMMGDEVLKKMKAINPTVQAIMITAYSEVETAVKVMKLGAGDFLEKPVDLSRLLEKIEEIEQRIAVDEDVAQVEKVVEEGPLPLKMIAQSTEMKDVISFIRRVAPSPWPVLIFGETGTGKELVAQLIHLLSPRGDSGPFTDVNCAAIPENLFESELFGHMKGAFTGAVKNRRGRFELAHGGSLLLDEIGEMPLLLQSKLLGALQQGRITRVGGEEDIQVDVRLITATNRNLKEMVKDGRFREDLYYRIKVFEIEIPPLRHRREDIPPLADFFLQRYAVSPITFSTDAMDILIKYPFPGNVRELEHIVQRTVTLARGKTIGPKDLPEEIRHHRAAARGTLSERLSTVEQEMILSALEKSGWVQTRAAEMLGISERVLRYKMKKGGIKNAGFR